MSEIPNLNPLSCLLPNQVAAPASPTGPESVSMVPLITQEELRSYYEHDAERKRLRERILTGLAAGATVEPGVYTARLQESVHRPLTQRFLRAILTDEGVDWLLQRVEPVKRLALYVRATRQASR